MAAPTGEGRTLDRPRHTPLPLSTLLPSRIQPPLSPSPHTPLLPPLSHSPILTLPLPSCLPSRHSLSQLAEPSHRRWKGGGVLEQSPLPLLQQQLPRRQLLPRRFRLLPRRFRLLPPPLQLPPRPLHLLPRCGLQLSSLGLSPPPLLIHLSDLTAPLAGLSTKRSELLEEGPPLFLRRAAEVDGGEGRRVARREGRRPREHMAGKGTTQRKGGRGGRQG